MYRPVVLFLLAALLLDLGLCRFTSLAVPPTPAPSPVVWPERAWRAFVASRVGGPTVERMARAAEEQVAACEELLGLLDPEEFRRLERDLPARAAALRRPVEEQAAEALAVLPPGDPRDKRIMIQFLDGIGGDRREPALVLAVLLRRPVGGARAAVERLALAQREMDAAWASLEASAPAPLPPPPAVDLTLAEFAERLRR